MSVERMKRRQKIFFVIIALLFGSCTSKHTVVSQPVIHPEENVIPPNHCRIRGTIITIDSTLTITDFSQPCAKVPCNAEVRIDSILGYGSAFGNPVVQGAQHVMHFVFTLSPTSKKLFPSMKEEYPGMTIGSSFIADIERQQSKSLRDVRGATQSMMPVFVIYGYTRLPELRR